ncbi:sensor histidine kinase [Actinoplanes couchii]|uniref:histidine kinase n=1 Tax=Actinoplanes couchii TaxID=403638 RepID=A0ABQ3XU73_9ACTN|nr:HAMP domain-containing sensor histidine kinase [Actinoplanes couchii]MDR6318685.1 signal transduction histidine kinase [Actinoplanes couchii]GID62015.1 two-component sensor histidine kinase [Actinoplanes couchii]
MLVTATVVTVAHRYWFYIGWFDWRGFEICDDTVYGVCGTVQRNSPVSSITLYLLTIAAILLLARPVGRWVLAPVRDVIPLVDQVGPQNLGLRIPDERRRDRELTALTASVNAMLTRLAAGYEGQRIFAANASHELRTPLALQRMIIEVSMTESLTAEQSALVTAQLLQANERSERIIEGLLTLSQAEQGIVAHTPQHLDTIVAETITAHRPEAETLKIDITCAVRPGKVTGDRILLERLVRNLVHNALKYNHPGGTVHVDVDGTGTLTVTNTGPIVPATELGRLFEPFTRLHGDRVDHSGGSGLGLAIVRAIVRSHGGTIDAAPNPDGGLRMTVRLPPSTS